MIAFFVLQDGVGAVYCLGAAAAFGGGGSCGGVSRCGAGAPGSRRPILAGSRLLRAWYLPDARVADAHALLTTAFVNQ